MNTINAFRYYFLALLFLWMHIDIVPSIVIEEVQTSPLPATLDGGGSTYSPDGKWYAYPSDSINNISIFSYDSFGNLTQISASPQSVTTPLSIATIAYSPDSKFLVATSASTSNLNNNRIALFSVNQATGALTQRNANNGAIGTFNRVTGGYAGGTIIYSPNGKFVAVSLLNPSTPTQGGVGMYTANATSGALTLINSASTPTSIFLTQHVTRGSTNLFTDSYIAFSPDSLYLAQANFDNTNTITIYTVNQTTGELGPLSGGFYGTDYLVPGGMGNFQHIAYSPDGNLLAVSSANTYFTFTLNNGIPTFADAYTPANGPSLYFSPDSQFLISTPNANTIDVIRVDSQGKMSLFKSLTPPLINQNTAQFAFSPLFPQNADTGLYFFSSVSTDFSSSPFLVSYRVFLTNPYIAGPQSPMGKRKCNIFLDKNERLLSISWSASVSSDVVSYNIYNGESLISSVLASSPFCLVTLLAGCDNGQNFSITAVDSNGLESERVPVTIT